MQKTDDIPLWVFLAFSNINTRKGALILILSNLAFSTYCIPWSLYYAEYDWVGTLFLINDWEWFSMTAPLNVWYWLCLKWMDKKGRWQPKTA